MNRSLLLLVAVSLAAGLLPSHAAAPTDAPAPTDPAPQDAGARAELAREPDLWLVTGRTQHIVPPWPVKGVSLTDPEVAEHARRVIRLRDGQVQDDGPGCSEQEAN